MRIVIGGDLFWDCRELAQDILRRLVARYGPDIVVANSGGCGVNQAFSLACRAVGVPLDYYRVEYHRVGDYCHENSELLRPGAGLCVILHRSTLDERTKDLARQALAAGVPMYLIDSEQGRPRRLKEGDRRLR